MLRDARSISYRWRRHHIAAVAALLLMTAASPARAGELESLRAENAKLRAENEALRARLDALEAKAQTATTAAGSPAGPGETRMEGVFVPRTRVSLHVARDASGGTSLASQWYRTSEGGVLPRKEWMQVRARQSPAGELAGAWLLIDREGSGSAKVKSGRFTVDGKTIEVPAEGYDQSDERREIGKITTSTHHEQVRFAIPPMAIAQIARANAVRFEAGSVSFELNDEQLAAFAAIAARAGTAQAAAKPASGK